MIVDTVLISHCKTENPGEQKYDLISVLSRQNLSKRDVHELYCIDRTQNKKHTSASCLRNPRFLIHRKNLQPLFIAITFLGSYVWQHTAAKESRSTEIGNSVSFARDNRSRNVPKMYGANQRAMYRLEETWKTSDVKL